MPDIDLDSLPPKEVYFLLTSLVIPRPIAWVSSVDSHGVPNLAPFSYFNIVSTQPPVIHFTAVGEKNSWTNAVATGEFVVNIVSEELLEAMNYTAADFPAHESEFAWAGIKAVPATRLSVPRVGAALASLECTVRKVMSIGNGNMVFGDVIYAHVSEAVWEQGRVQPHLLRPVGRLAGTTYAPLGNIIKLLRPTWADIRAGDAKPAPSIPASQE